ncbi:hypothetical protein TGDOM2_289870 [Toxoplasma gondii GAB2-2007-GAL-DOM2]|uniref:Uncharacterized protein n=3 Tax=Toxoplasma gondii TaxID=5811 RepID=A0A086L9N7_TOXGO|nr:hypothetical protein TGDOM2_289870 [Toxoplasma gondii GAB2-2007-GAL-DOM2]KFG53355.1 hypothetical protein TGFOU_289870 [Toxoplasma gondii FOU]RQX73730.1 hypothetical protein TGCAST_289870 [Toxoplasma gondii CAST]
MKVSRRTLFLIVALTAGLEVAVEVNSVKTKSGQFSSGLGSEASQFSRQTLPGLTLEVQPDDDDEDYDLFPDELGASYEGVLSSMTSLSPEEMTAAEDNIFVPQEVPGAKEVSSINHYCESSGAETDTDRSTLLTHCGFWNEHSKTAVV